MLHKKLMRMKYRTQFKQILCILHTLDSWDEVKWSKQFFLKVAMLHIKLKGKKCSATQHASKVFDRMHTPDLLGWVKTPDIEIVQIRSDKYISIELTILAL